MKSEADPKRRSFFLEITAFLGQKVHYLATISSDDFVFREYLESRTKIGYERHDIRTRVWEFPVLKKNP